jgi:hypothetical protein
LAADAVDRTPDKTGHVRPPTEHGWLTVRELAGKIYGPDDPDDVTHAYVLRRAYSESRIKALRRALRSLERKGLIVCKPRHRQVTVWHGRKLASSYLVDLYGLVESAPV